MDDIGNWDYLTTWYHFRFTEIKLLPGTEISTVSIIDFQTVCFNIGYVATATGKIVACCISLLSNR